MGKIYTGYCAKAQSYPADMVKIGIMRFPPVWWKDAGYMNLHKLAPSKDLLDEWHAKAIDEYMFRIKYYAELRERGATPNNVRLSLESLDRDVILCCYERPDEFCHRHLLAKWLGEDVEEYGNGEKGV